MDVLEITSADFTASNTALSRVSELQWTYRHLLSVTRSGNSRTTNPSSDNSSSGRRAAVAEYLACSGEGAWRPWTAGLSTAGFAVLLARPESARGGILGDDSAVRRLVTGDTMDGGSPPVLDARPRGGLTVGDWTTSGGGGGGGGGGSSERWIRDGAKQRSSCGDAVFDECWRPSSSVTASTTLHITQRNEADRIWLIVITSSFIRS